MSEPAGTEALPNMPEIPAPDSLEVRVGVVLANTTDSTGEVYLGTLDAQQLAEVLMRVELDPLVELHRREIVRLVQLVDAAQVARNQAQADAAMYADVVEAVRQLAVELREYSDTAPPGEFEAWPNWFGSRVLALLDEVKRG